MSNGGVNNYYPLNDPTTSNNSFTLIQDTSKLGLLKEKAQDIHRLATTVIQRLDKTSKAMETQFYQAPRKLFQSFSSIYSKFEEMLSPMISTAIKNIKDRSVTTIHTKISVTSPFPKMMSNLNSILDNFHTVYKNNVDRDNEPKDIKSGQFRSNVEGVFRISGSQSDLGKISKALNTNSEIENISDLSIGSSIFWSSAISRSCTEVLNKMDKGELREATNPGTKEYQQMQNWCMEVAKTLKQVADDKSWTNMSLEKGVKIGTPSAIKLLARYNISLEEVQNNGVTENIILKDGQPISSPS